MPKISNGTAEGLLKAMFRECPQLEPLVYKAYQFHHCSIRAIGV